MKFAVSLPLGRIDPKGEFQSGEAVRICAQAVEAAGIHAALTSEHPAPSSHWLHNDPTGHDCVDPLVALAFAAAATTTLKFMTNVLILPFRNPFLTAKAAATFQLLSDNRLILGVGSGYQREEFDALGVAWNKRGALMDEALETINLAWAGGPVTKQGLNFNANGVEPRPVPDPRPPIWVGGGADAAVTRAAKFGDGWVPYFSAHSAGSMTREYAVYDMEHFSEKVRSLQAQRAQFGRGGPFDIAVGSPFRPKTTTPADARKLLETAKELQSRGATWLWVPFHSPTRAEYLETIAWFGAEIVAKF